MPAPAVQPEGTPPPFTPKYAVERIIGRGGMGTVFEARHAVLGHKVAIKVLGNELRLHPELVRRFEREARAAASLSSPHAIRIFDIDKTDDGTPFMVMELLGGCDLARLIENEGAQPIGLAVRWVIDACHALAEAHRLGIVHRDIKPSNLHRTDDGTIKVLDFGIAKHVATSTKEAAITQGLAPLGTPQYMSPEQVRCAKDVDARSDIWSLGVTLYELLTGRPPYNHEVPQACIAAIAADPVPDPRDFRADIPEALAAVILHALAKDPNDRFANADELVEALSPFADPAPTRERAISSSAMRRAFSDDTTLDGDDLEDAPDASVVLPLRPPMKSDETIPPTVTPAARASRGRLRSSLALAGAALLTVVGVVATSRAMDSHAATASGVLAHFPVVQAAAASTTPLLEAVSFEEPAGAVETTIAAPIRAAAAPKAASTTRPAPKRASSPLVHGGLSNPGF